MSVIRPFRIAVPDNQLQQVQKRISEAVLPAWTDQGWQSGPPEEYVRKLAHHLLNEYDWREHEAALNRWPHFVTEIDGQRIHLLHIKSQSANTTPLLLLHGRPSSFLEFTDLIGPLCGATAGGVKGEDTFNLVIP